MSRRHRSQNVHRYAARALGRGLLAATATVASVSAQSVAAPHESATPTLDSTTRARIDSMFASYIRADAPGCALLVRRDGTTAYARGYGMASLELGVPITPATVMDIASTSKQFTATAVWMLALEGKLSLDDEVQRYLPELPRLGPGPAYRVTIRQMLQHTSGWPDYVDLLLAGGTPFEAASTANDAMAVLARQRVGNFAPGTEWMYSNTGYFLAGQIVERLTGMSMREFLRTRVFAPLGMTHTDVFDDHTRLYPGHANGYTSTPGGGWRVERTNWEQTGDGAIQTSVEDLARWDANFDTPVVGTRALLDSLQQPARLVDGTPLTYAYGLFVDSFRGVRRVHHGGGYPGYQSEVMRFPEQRTSILITCNGPTWTPRFLAEKVAVIVLGSALGPTEGERLRDSLGTLPLATRTALRGVWWDPSTGSVLRIALRDSVALQGDGPGDPVRPLAQLAGGWLISTPVGDRTPRMRFDASTGHLLVLSRNLDGARLSFERVAPVAPRDMAQRAAYAGQYTSRAVPGLWTVAARRDTLWLSVGGGRPLPIEPLFHDAFQSEYGVLRFQRDARGHIAGLHVTTYGVRELRFIRREAGDVYPANGH